MTDQQAARECGEPVAWAHNTKYGRGYSFAQELLDHLDRWLPIESAPKDGRYVLLYDAQRMGEYLMAQWFHGAWWGRRTLSGKCITWGSATHWQPLPAPPRPTQERSDEQG